MNTEEVAAYGGRLASQYGLKVTSHVRTPDHNRRVGGARNSDHLTGLAIDLAGDPGQMEALAVWARANMGDGKLFRWVGWGDEGHQDHVHLSFNTAASNETPTASAGTSGEETMMATQAPPVLEQDPLPPDATDEQIRDWVQENAPEISWMLGNEEIMGAVVDWVRADEPDERLADRLRDTEYFKTHGPTSREFDNLIATDRRAAIELIDKKIIEVDQAFQRQGVKKDKTELGEIAKKAIRGGWSPQDLDRFIVSEMRGGALAPGDAAADADALTALARSYLVPITRRDAEEWSLRIMEGTANEDSFRSWLTGLAKARFASQPDILATIEGGMTPGQYFAGHKATVANILELGDDQIDLMDPKWSWMIELADPKGGRRAPTLGEVAQLARDRPEFAGTRTYKEQEASYSVGLSKFLGVAA